MPGAALWVITASKWKGEERAGIVRSLSCETRSLQERSACNEEQPLEFLLVKIPILLFFSPLSSCFRLEDMITSTSIYGMCFFFVILAVIVVSPYFFYFYTKLSIISGYSSSISVLICACLRHRPNLIIITEQLRWRYFKKKYAITSEVYVNV